MRRVSASAKGRCAEAGVAGERGTQVRRVPRAGAGAVGVQARTGPGDPGPARFDVQRAQPDGPKASRLRTLRETTTAARRDLSKPEMLGGTQAVFPPRRIRERAGLVGEGRGCVSSRTG
ncbi:hypothetical protein [Streptomyces griseorubiginosus]|uniref:hypothetical protein n=1 Tax=Streptomyces griseorubiginosus TaxID=67304 RepID=UPI001AD77FD4|nr:hypothetical protein [Streptomyces griseorubiginosus]MBO4252706.1 hypothetical protein [Streptomyces griseorubiginosus]